MKANVLAEIEAALNSSTPGVWGAISGTFEFLHKDGAGKGAMSADKDGHLLVLLKNNAPALLAAIHAGQAWLRSDDWARTDAGDGLVQAAADTEAAKFREAFRAVLQALTGDPA